MNQFLAKYDFIVHEMGGRVTFLNLFHWKRNRIVFSQGQKIDEENDVVREIFLLYPPALFYVIVVNTKETMTAIVKKQKNAP